MMTDRRHRDHMLTKSNSESLEVRGDDQTVCLDRTFRIGRSNAWASREMDTVGLFEKKFYISNSGEENTRRKNA